MYKSKYAFNNDASSDKFKVFFYKSYDRWYGLSIFENETKEKCELVVIYLMG